jgi:hypothetical protein
MAIAQNAVSDAFAEMGISVPASTQAFYDLVHGLDLSTQAGRDMFDSLMAVAPAFSVVAQAAAAAVNSFNQIASSLSPGYGSLLTQGNFSTALGGFNQQLVSQGGTAWTQSQAMTNIQRWISNPLEMQSALAYAQSLGGDAVNQLTAMLTAFQSMTQATNTAPPRASAGSGKRRPPPAAVARAWAPG